MVKMFILSLRFLIAAVTSTIVGLAVLNVLARVFVTVEISCISTPYPMGMELLFGGDSWMNE